jgi:hypothetical protein
VRNAEMEKNRIDRFRRCCIAAANSFFIHYRTGIGI